MFDTHCHLDKFFDSSQPDITIANSLAPSLTPLFNAPDNHYLSVSTSNSDWKTVLDIALRFSHVYAALGLHPWFVTKQSLMTLDELYNLLNSNVVHAIGEIGLDFSHQYNDNFDSQIEAFNTQLSMANEFDLPVSMHLVKSHNEALQLLKKHSVKGVVHGLGTSIEMAQHYVDLGLKIGVNGVIVRDNAVRYHKLIQYFGLEYIVLETDYPNIMLPGLVTSHLEDINIIANAVATLLNISIQDVINVTNQNAKQIFVKGQ